VLFRLLFDCCGQTKNDRRISDGSDRLDAQVALPRSMVALESLPTSTTTIIKSVSVVREEKKTGGLFGRPEINCDRIPAFARDRAHARPARFILSLFIAESLFYLSLSFFSLSLSLSLFLRSFIFMHLESPRSAEIFNR